MYIQHSVVIPYHRPVKRALDFDGIPRNGLVFCTFLCFLLFTRLSPSPHGFYYHRGRIDRTQQIIISIYVYKAVSESIAYPHVIFVSF